MSLGKEQMSFPIVQTSGGSYLVTKLVRGTFSTIMRVHDKNDTGLCVERNVLDRDIAAWYPNRAIHGFSLIHQELIQEWVEKYGKKNMDTPQLSPSPQKIDPVNHPPHYTQGGIEVMDAIEAWGCDFIEGNIIKYVARWKHKNGVTDLRKAEWYLKRLIDREIKNVSDTG